jgi:hypothetical protein
MLAHAYISLGSCYSNMYGKGNMIIATEGMRVGCTPGVIAQRCNWPGTPDAKLDPI